MKEASAAKTEVQPTTESALTQSQPDFEAMRIKLEIDKSVGLPDEFSKVWFELDGFLHRTIDDCEREISNYFQLDGMTLGLDLDGFRLLGHLTTSRMLQDGSSLRVYRTLSTVDVMPTPSNGKKRERPSSAISPTHTPSKQAKTSSSQAHPQRVTLSPFVISEQPKPKSTKIKAKKTVPVSSSPSSSTTTTSSSSYTSTSTSSSSSESSSDSTTTSTTSSSSSSSDEAPPKPQTRVSAPSHPSATPTSSVTTPNLNKRRRKANQIAESKARNDYVQAVSRVYVNLFEDTGPVSVHQYDTLPKIALADVVVGQIVAWRMFCLSPLVTPGYSPWQERQLVTVSSEGLTFRSHNLNAYLASWWLDDDGEKLCTVRDWLKENADENPLDVTLPLDFADLGDLRLLHSADSSS